MRIVAGKFGSRKLKTLKGQTTRPSSSKVRAAVFDHMGSFFTGGKMLDVFSGSGAMAFEALSRGFDSAVCFEKDRQAQKIIKENRNTLGLEKEVQIIAGDSLRLLPKQKDVYDLIYVDPPYGFAKSETVLQYISYLNLLSESGICIFETNQKDLSFEQIAGLSCYQSKSYGEAQLYYYQKS